MKNDDFTKQVTSKLDGLARNHQNKAVVMNNVLENIQERSLSRYSFWKMGGFALAAAITGFVILPNAFDLSEKQHQQQVVINPKLSPQMVEDLEMLSVFGEDKSSHGS
ncbi:hypothetical protein [Acinetobacter stercoris]|uniref:Uncharacterized protein n=1 Tax=Acinetobacter stercoris TaxID=2126983 RepID=A0A2U3MZG3_9GAMM|nr:MULTISPECIES: hypothetical protein [Acinetobacter]SPL70784.1 hypothetical protein KPC_1962 [Acinetobacter stercoris]